LRGEGLFKPLKQLPAPELQPILKNLHSLVNDLESSRRVLHASEITWSAKKLKEILQKELAGEEVLILANREPYSHVHVGDKIEVRAPASGLVTALEPILRACSGTWIAHGSGDADREVVDRRTRVQVPPSDPAYVLKRVWLTPQQENGYYNGFSNQAMWPLCHLAHARPIFRKSDWEYYQEVNQLFADAVCEEAKTQDPVVLVQDYHFALAPKKIKERLPRATVITFWHIPWPNPEVFSICPWREEILEGLLGSTVMGFHTRMHCLNFMDTVERFLEARVDREHSTLSFQKSLTAVRSYPISIEWPPRWLKNSPPVADCHRAIRKRLGLSESALVGVGVDRLDYTKGILERFRAVDRLLELYPHWIGKFFFVQISAPSRTQVPSYTSFQNEVLDLYKAINAKYAPRGAQPIILLPKHHEPEELAEYYRGANLCFVSSLHDGMNLVAKEFVASRDDEQGTLVLSTFTGAAQELTAALLVNPYAIDPCAEALNAGLEMAPAEQRERMRLMRGLIADKNIYRWAGGILLDAAQIKKRERFESWVGQR
jgi:trehalose 6-phosphate synthase